MLTKERIVTPEDALLYLTECNLATVEEMKGKKSKSKGEFSRQISIAQVGMTSIQKFKTDCKDTLRVLEVAKTFNYDVNAWVNRD